MRIDALLSGPDPRNALQPQASIALALPIAVQRDALIRPLLPPVFVPALASSWPGFGMIAAGDSGVSGGVVHPVHHAD